MYFTEKSLLSSPISRAAYSDRTAWLMAEMSRLAYFKFEEENAKTILSTYLGEAGFKIIDTFNEKDTQAFFAIRASDKMVVLAFRGTEKNITDIRTDLKTTKINFVDSDDSFAVHEGFYEAFKSVENKILKHLKDLDKGYVLYITGHSLGGALALIATKFLGSDSLGACYTFGGPRVATLHLSNKIKTPIYRVVNAADIVPHLPPAFLPRILATTFVFLPIPYLRNFLVTYFKKMIGYRHHGDMRSLTECSSDSLNLILVANPNFIDRGYQFVRRLITTKGTAPVADHDIEIYCEKLKEYALNRNKIHEVRPVIKYEKHTMADFFLNFNSFMKKERHIWTAHKNM